MTIRPAPSPIASPTATSERVHVLDALRGFALFGIFLANIRFFSGWEYLAPTERAELSGQGYALFDFIHLAAIDGKFYTLFSFLFGIGFALQLSRLEGRGAAATRIYLRRTTILLVIGAVHLFVFWVGDILLPYAVLGFVLLFVRGLADRTLLLVAALSLTIPVIGYSLFWIFEIDQSLGLYRLATLMPGGSWGFMEDIQLTSWHDRFQSSFSLGVLRLGHLFDTWRWPKLFAIMLLGLWAGRQLIKGQLLNNTKLLWSVLILGGLCGAVAGPVLANLDGIGFQRPHSRDGLLAVIAYTFAVIPLGLAYAAGFALLWKVIPHVLNVFSAPGRMALTNYLAQTAIGLWVFYGVGLSQAGLWSIQSLLLFACAVFAGQVIVSNIWLRYFLYGPMEWLWRALTYGSAPQFRRLTSPATTTSMRNSL